MCCRGCVRRTALWSCTGYSSRNIGILLEFEEKRPKWPGTYNTPKKNPACDTCNTPNMRCIVITNDTLKHLHCLYTNYQLDALIIVYSQNTILLYMFRASSAHLQEDIVVYKQHMVPSLSIRVLVACRYAASCISTGHQDSYREWRYHMLLVYNYVLLKMSAWCSKHVKENSVLWINNNQCIKLVISV